MPTPVVPLAHLERKAILNALAYTKGERAMAAQLLGIGRTTLYRKVKEYGLGAEVAGGRGCALGLDVETIREQGTCCMAFGRRCAIDEPKNELADSATG